MAIALALAGLAAAFLIFAAGVFVGFHKAEFSYRWAENYRANFIGSRAVGGMMGAMFGKLGERGFIDPYGAAGKIIEIDSAAGGQPSLIVKGEDGAEKTILVKKDAIRKFSESAKIGDLQIGDFIVAIGRPNDQGQIEAKFVRIMPAPASSSASFAPRAFMRFPF